nr:immunoglobulin heavy chain junction region [Mus musculus]MBK4196417.1 immunoglobulin heavy chain junction region [Mus musculus]MBK4196418.1 immunoglobulin heavy chain junction region [Mus musculus]MBK4196421.1 immunoglobulin heavy chain junction region [Mus musculus]
CARNPIYDGHYFDYW